MLLPLQGQPGKTNPTAIPFGKIAVRKEKHQEWCCLVCKGFPSWVSFLMSCLCLYYWWIWLLSPFLSSWFALPHHWNEHNPALPAGLLLWRWQHQVPAEDDGDDQWCSAVCCRHPHRHPRSKYHLWNLLSSPLGIPDGFLSPLEPMAPMSQWYWGFNRVLLVCPCYLTRCASPLWLFDFRVQCGAINICKWKLVMGGMRLVLKPVNRARAVWASLWAPQ